MTLCIASQESGMTSQCMMRVHTETHRNQAYYDMPVLNQHLADGIVRRDMREYESNFIICICLITIL